MFNMNYKFLLGIFFVLVFSSTQIAYGGGSGSESSESLFINKIISKCN